MRPVASTARVPRLYQGTVLTLACLANVLGGLAATLMAAYLPDAVRDLMGSMDAAVVGHVGSYVGSVFLVGWALGGVMLGWAGDRLGRVRMLVAAIATYALFTLASAWAPSWHWLVLCRFLTGIGVGATLVLSAVVVAEAWDARSRAVALGIVAVGFPIGVILSGVVNYVVADWRAAFLVGFLPLVLAVVSRLLLRESDAWSLLEMTRTDVGHEVRRLLDRTNRRDFLVGATIFGAMLVGIWATFSWLPTWVQSLVGEGVDGQRERGLAVMLLGLGGIGGSILSGFLANAVGRRRALLIAFGGCIVASALLFKTNVGFTPVVYVQTAFLAVFFGISQGTLTAYVPELFPTEIRSTATGVSFNLGRLVTAAAVFFVGVLVVTLGGYGNAIFAFSLTYVIGFVATLYGRETKGVDLAAPATVPVSAE